VNFATQTLLDWGIGVSRNSGDAASKYNWKLDYTNSANDYYWYPSHPSYPTLLTSGPSPPLTLPLSHPRL
jgi:hypothetical protein